MDTSNEKTNNKMNIFIIGKNHYNSDQSLKNKIRELGQQKNIWL